MGRIALDRLTADLESYYFGKGGFFLGEKKDEDSGRADQLTFTSTAHLVFSKKELPAGYALIRYSTEKDEETGMLRLYRIDKTIRPGDSREAEDGKGFLLCDGLKEIRFSYFDVEGNERDEWNSDEVEGQQQFPALMKITLRFAKSAETQDITVFSTAVSMLRLSGRSGQ